MTWWGIKLTQSNVARYVAGTHIPLAFGYASIAFGFGSGAVHSFCALVRRIGGLFHKKGKEETAQ